MLEGEGFNEVYNLIGGIKAWQGVKAHGPAEVGMGQITGKESPDEIIVISYGMENGLKIFYEIIKEGVENPEIKELASKLAGIEQGHKEKLFQLYLATNHGVDNIGNFEDDIVSNVMEGGFTVNEFMEKNREAMNETEGILTVAMMLEAQALDLYLRYSRKMVDEEVKEVLYRIAQDEKRHLAALGTMLEKIVEK